MILHERENSEITENHLKDNGEKFNNHCVAVLKLLYAGLRLTARELETKYNMDGRRLRDVYAARKDVKREWVKGEDGKTKWVQYYLQIEKPPTKTETIKKWETATQLNIF